MLLSGIAQVGAAWYARSTYLQAFSRSILVYTAVYILTALVCGVFGMSDSGLILAVVFSLVGQILSLMYYLDIQGYQGKLTKSRICCSFRNNIQLATTATGVTFVNTLSLTAPIFLLAQVYPVSDLGVYALMTRLVTTPLGVLTKSLSLSFWSKAAEYGREKKIGELNRLYIKVCMVMTIPALMVAIVCFIGSYFIVPILGSQWQGSSAVLLAIIPFVVGSCIASPTNHLWVIDKQSYQFIADGARLLLMLFTTIAASNYQWSFNSAVLLLSISSFIGHALLVGIHIYLHRQLMRSV
jgi:O-antigen/teichoic acid export membrane protein